MIIDVNTMFNYQVINNGSIKVGAIHSYAEKMISNSYLNKSLTLYRKNKMALTIIKAILVEE